MAKRKDGDGPSLDREARARIGKALRAALPPVADPPSPDQADLLARLQRAQRERPRR
jgi:hypothetical protein